MIITPKKEYEKLTKGSDKKVKLKCNNCGKISETTFNNFCNSQKRRKNDGKTYCHKCAMKIVGINKAGKPAWNKGKKFPHLSGKNSIFWKGGRYISSDGYWMIYIGNNNNHKIKWNNYRKEHCVIAEEKLGRKLKLNEVVHHIDCDKLNNNFNNLDILQSENEHRQAHLSLEKIAIELLKTGHISYNNGKYVANVKLRELLEHPHEDNQQPSLISNDLEGSETRSESNLDNNSSTSAGHSMSDDIVRPIHINKSIELEDKEPLG